MKDLGELEIIQGIKKTRTPNGLKLSQGYYVEKILRKFEHFHYKISISTLWSQLTTEEKQGT